MPKGFFDPSRAEAVESERRFLNESEPHQVFVDFTGNLRIPCAGEHCVFAGEPVVPIAALVIVPSNLPGAVEIDAFVHGKQSDGTARISTIDVRVKKSGLDLLSIDRIRRLLSGWAAGGTL